MLSKKALILLMMSLIVSNEKRFDVFSSTGMFPLSVAGVPSQSDVNCESHEIIPSGYISTQMSSSLIQGVVSKGLLILFVTLSF